MSKKYQTDLDEARKGICEHCKNETWVRKVEFFGMFAKASRESSRGWASLCYKCFGPRIIWNKGNTEMRTPMNIPHDKIDDFLSKRFDCLY